MSNEFLYVTDGLKVAEERRKDDIAVNHSYRTYVSVTVHL